MDQLETLRLLFAIALLSWVLAALVFARLYLWTLAAEGWRYPFLVGGVFVAVSNALECMLYAYVLWLDPGNRDLARRALYVIPIGLTAQAVGYMVVAAWALLGARPR